MKAQILTLIIAHGDVARALADGVQQIIGPQINVYTFSNQEAGLPQLLENAQTIIDSHPDDHVVCFNDLKGGSCWTLANMIQKRNPQVKLISGVNLPMLITYFNNISSMELQELIDKTAQDGCRGIVSQ
jgi:mannose/fructose-specific phosphotransferase system component IIA